MPRSCCATASARYACCYGFTIYSVLRLQHDLDAVVFLVVEEPVAIGRVIEAQAMRDDEARIDLAVLDAFQQRLHVPMHVTLAGLDRQRAIHHRAHRKLVDEAAVDADHRYRPAIAAAT